MLHQLCCTCTIYSYLCICATVICTCWGGGDGLSEAIHTFADLINSLMLWLGGSVGALWLPASLLRHFHLLLVLVLCMLRLHHAS